jgi:hypothetical protein
MNWRQLGRLLQLARETPGVLRQPLTPEKAMAQVRERMATRESRFLHVLRRLVYDDPKSPYRRLLEWAGCEYADLERSVATCGVESTLEQLRDAGVCLSLEEFKRIQPITRSGLVLEPEEGDFDNRLVVASGGGMQAATSGSRAAATRVTFNWESLTEQAACELLLASHHGVLDEPLALWYPVLPSVAGVHNLLENLKFGRPPVRWFSQVHPKDLAILDSLSIRAIRWTGKSVRLFVPQPEFAGVDHPDGVLDWMSSVHESGRRSTIRTFASSAVRLAARARQRELKLSGTVIFTGGEPLTEPRRRFIESAGWHVFPRYAAAETGVLGAGCLDRTASDDMHLYIDRVAVIGGSSVRGNDNALLITTLSMHTGRVLLNTDLGDSGNLVSSPCGCVFGELGFNQRVADVRSQERLTIEGMTVPTASLDNLLSGLVEEAGGAPDSHQFWATQDAAGLVRLVVALSPDLGPLDEEQFLETLYDRMVHGGPALDLAARFWKQARTIRIVREDPRQSNGAKLRPVRRLAAPSAEAQRP